MALIPRTSTAIHAKDTVVQYYVPETFNENTQQKIGEHLVEGKVFQYDESRNTYDVRIPSWQLISVSADNCYDPQNDSIMEIPKEAETAAPEKIQPSQTVEHSETDIKDTIVFFAKIAIGVCLVMAIVFAAKWVLAIKPSQNAPTGLNEAVVTLNRENLEDVPLLQDREAQNAIIKDATEKKLAIEKKLRKNKEEKDAALKIINSFRK